MQALTREAQQVVASLAQRYGISEDAVRTMLFAVSAGNGTMAQFYHVELGGGGQWMRGGMTMVGDMFNHGLKSRWTAFAMSFPRSSRRKTSSSSRSPLRPGPLSGIRPDPGGPPPSAARARAAAR